MTDWPAGAEHAIQTAVEVHTTDGSVPGLVWLASRGDDVIGGVAGVMAEDGSPMRRDALFRVASISKPVTAAAALSAIEAGVFGLDEPVERWLPELADRRVVRRSEGPLDDTVPADRPITVRDLLTFTSGYGVRLHQLRGPGPDRGADPPRPRLRSAGAGPDAAVDEWMARLGTIPLDHQPGAAWRYHLSSELLGVLLARAEGEPLEAVLRRRVLAPAGMVDTAFSIEPSDLERMTTSYVVDEETGAPAGVRPTRRAVGGPAAVPVRRWRARLDGGRLPRLRHDVAPRRRGRRRPRRLGRVGGGHDERSDPRPARHLARWGHRVGVRRRRPASERARGGDRRARTAGSAGWARSG